MNTKLISLLILLLIASCASATTLHGTMVDADTGSRIAGVSVISTSTDTTDANGRFDITTQSNGCFISFDCENPCYHEELELLPLYGYSEYYPDTDEIWLIYNVPSCDSTTQGTSERDPTHPGPNSGNGGTTPAGNSITSTASRWGGAIVAVLLTVTAIAISVLAGIISAPAISILLIIAGLAALIGFVVIPILAKLPIVGKLFGGIQDLGAWLLDQFGFDLNTTDAKTAGEAITDGITDIIHTITETVIETITETIIKYIIDPIIDKTGLSETIVWVILGIAVAFVLLMWYSQRQNQSIMYTLTAAQNRIKGKK